MLKQQEAVGQPHPDWLYLHIIQGASIIRQTQFKLSGQSTSS